MVPKKNRLFLLIVLLLAAFMLVGCSTPTGTVSEAASAANPASAAGITDQPALPASTATPAPWPVVQSTPLPSGGEIRWFRQLQADPQFKVTMVAAGTAVAIDGPVPVGDIVAAGIVVSYIWVASDAPQIIADAVIDGVENLKLWADARAAEYGQVAVHPAAIAAQEQAYFVDPAEIAAWEAELSQFLAQPPVSLAIDPVVDPSLGYGPTAVAVVLDDGSAAVMPDPDWVINMSVNHGDKIIQVPGLNGTPPVEVGDQSLLVMRAVVARAQRLGGKLCPRGDCRSNGSVNLFLAKQIAYPEYGYVVIQLVEGRGVFFVVLRAPLENSNGSLPPGGALTFGDGTFIQGKSLKWLCSWVAGFRVKNGHGVQGSPAYMGRGWEQWWTRVASRYNPLIQITSMEVPIPPIVAEFIVK